MRRTARVVATAATIGSAAAGACIPDELVGPGGSDAGIDGSASPVTLAVNQQNPWGIAVDDASVYWTNMQPQFQGTVMACATGGCNNSPTQLDYTQNEPQAIAVDSTNVYWVNWGDHSVMTCAVANCASTQTPLTSGDGGQTVWAIAVDGTSVYWTMTSGVKGTVMKWTKDGGAAGPIASNLDGGAMLGIAVYGGNVYWTSVGLGGSGTVMMCADGDCDGGPTLLSSAQPSPGAIAVDSTSVYWTNTNGVVKCAISGCGPNPIVLASGSPQGIAIDDTAIYWTNDTSDGSVMKCAKSGCDDAGPNVLASGQAFAFGIAVDSTNVYWTDKSTVKKTAK